MKYNNYKNIKYNNNKIIAIGDLHGDYPIFIELLKLAKIINNNLKWIGGKTYVIQVGDTVDGLRPGIVHDKKYLNTPYEIKILNFILKLDKDAKKHGGRMISLLGNHELYPYYNKKENQQINKEYVKEVDNEQYKQIFKISRDDFYCPYFNNLQYSGNIGRGARVFGYTRPLILQLGQFIFCHGSLNTEFLKMYTKNGKFDINKVNEETSKWLSGEIKNAPKYINTKDEIHPLFNRDLTSPESFTKKECNELVKPLFKYFNNAKCIIMGHSTHDKISPICNNRLYRIDIAASRAFGGNLKQQIKKLQVLEITQTNNKFKTTIISN